MKTDPQTEARFHRAVNMTVAQLRAWLRTPESRAVGFRRRRSTESVGHASGRRIIRLLQNGAQTESDLRHMRKVAGYVARHLKQRPAGDVTETRWRYSLMNWGHDPIRDVCPRFHEGVVREFHGC